MTQFKKLAAIVGKLEEAEKKINLNETVKLLNAVKDISTQKDLIEKVICLVLLIETQTESISKLTIREVQVFNLIGCGFTTEEIGQILTISTATVATHRKNIIKKLNLHKSGQLRRLAYHHVHEKAL